MAADRTNNRIAYYLLRAKESLLFLIENFTKVAHEEITTDYKKMFDILKKAPHFEFAGVEFFGNDISRNQGVKLTKNLIEKVTK